MIYVDWRIIIILYYSENVSFLLQDPAVMLKLVCFIEKKTHWGQGKNQTKTSILTVVEDIPDTDIEKYLSTPSLEAPKLTIFRSGSSVTGMYVVADTKFCQIEVRSGITSALMTLLAMYYLFDLDYPRKYAMFLGAVQVLVMEEPFKKATSQSYKLFMKEARSKLN